MNAITNPDIVARVGALHFEQMAKYLMPKLFEDIENDLNDSNYFYFQRPEHGSNGNPHAHLTNSSEKMGMLYTKLCKRMDDKFSSLLEAHEGVWNDSDRDLLKKSIIDEWRDCQKEIISNYKGMYHNWNPGKTASLKKTMDYSGVNLSSLNMDKVIDDYLSQRDIYTLDKIFLSVLCPSQSHINHSGENGAPGPKDYCYRKKLKKRNDADKSVLVSIWCNRRFPVPPRAEPAITQDVHKNKYTQLYFALNDEMFNSYNPFLVLACLSNVDTKAIVFPEFSRRPKFFFSEDGTDVRMELHLSAGSPELEYILKYINKGFKKPKTDERLLAAVNSDKKNDNDIFGLSDIKKMYVRAAIADQEVCVFAACSINSGLPLYLTNIEYNGISINNSVQRLNAREGNELFYTQHIEQFDNRLDKNKISNFDKLGVEVKGEQSMQSFFTKFYTTKDNKSRNPPKDKIIIRKDRALRSKMLQTVCPMPTLNLSSFNPANDNYWMTERVLYLWFCKHNQLKDTLSLPLEEQQKLIHEKVQKYFIDTRGTPNQYRPISIPNQSSQSQSCSESSQSSLVSSDYPPKLYNVFIAMIRHYLDKTIIEKDEEIEDDISREFLISRKLRYETTQGKLEEEVAKKATKSTNPKKHPDKKTKYQTEDDKLMSIPRGYIEVDGQIEPHSKVSNTVDDIIPDNMIGNPSAISLDDCIRENLLGHVGDFDVYCDHWQRTVKSFKPKVEPLPQDMKGELNTKQTLFADQIVAWSQAMVKGEDVLPLRLVVIGIPGCGKTFSFRHTVATQLLDIFTDFSSEVLIVTPMGKTSFAMSYSATTIHSKFNIKVGKVGEPIVLDGKSIDQVEKILSRIDGSKVKLIIFDECSMVSTVMMSAIIERCIFYKINLDKVGIVWIGDPAQTSPIGGFSLWSTLFFTEGQHKLCDQKSWSAVHNTRRLFGMLPLEKVPGYDPSYDRNSNDRDKFKPTQANYNHIKNYFRTFLRHAFKGNFQGIWFDETRRTNSSPEGKMLEKIIRNARYSKWSESILNTIKDHSLTAEQAEVSEDFQKHKVVLTGYHYFNELNPNRDNVDTMNAQELLKFDQGKGNLIKLSSLNAPFSCSELSPKEFQNLHNTLYFCKGCPLILTQNINPCVGLTNGAECTFEGIRYRDNCLLEIITRFPDLEKMKLDSKFYTTQQIVKYDGKGTPIIYEKGLCLVKLNNIPPTQEALYQLKENNILEIEAEFECPKEPPFIRGAQVVVNVPDYNGPPLFPGDAAKRHFVILEPVTQFKKTNKNEPKICRFQVPLESASVMTVFKAIGQTHKYTQLMMNGFFQNPGLFYFGISRVPALNHL